MLRYTFGMHNKRSFFIFSVAYAVIKKKKKVLDKIVLAEKCLEVKKTCEDEMTKINVH